MCWLQNGLWSGIILKSYEGHMVVMWTDCSLFLSKEVLLWRQSLTEYAEKSPHLNILCNIAQKVCTWVVIFLRRLFLLGHGPENLIYLKDSKTWAYCCCTEKFSWLWKWWQGFHQKGTRLQSPFTREDLHSLLTQKHYNTSECGEENRWFFFVYLGVKFC